MSQMIRAGLRINIVIAPLIALLATLLTPLVFGG